MSGDHETAQWNGVSSVRDKKERREATTGEGGSETSENPSTNRNRGLRRPRGMVSTAKSGQDLFGQSNRPPPLFSGVLQEHDEWVGE